MSVENDFSRMIDGILYRLTKNGDIDHVDIKISDDDVKDATKLINDVDPEHLLKCVIRAELLMLEKDSWTYDNKNFDEMTKLKIWLVKAGYITITTLITSLIFYFAVTEQDSILRGIMEALSVLKVMFFE